MSRLRSYSAAKGRRQTGNFGIWPHDCGACESYARLSLPARALLLEFLGQLHYGNNGDLCCAFGTLGPRGWKAKSTIERARQELEDTGWIIRTRQGGGNRPNLYAVTWRSIDYCGDKLDVPAGPAPGTWSRSPAPVKKSFDLERSNPRLEHSDPKQPEGVGLERTEVGAERVQS